MEEDMEIKEVLLKRSDLHLLRKAWHIVTGLTGLAIYFSLDVPAKSVGQILLIFGLASIAFELLRLKVESVNKLVVTYMGLFMRESEKNSISGLPFYALGVGLSLTFFEEPIAIISTLFLVFSDPISSAFGIKFGTQKIYGNKSLEGSVAGFITCFIVVMVYGLLFFPVNINLFAFALIASTAGCFAELLSTKIDDNLMIPVVSGVAMTITNWIIPIV